MISELPDDILLAIISRMPIKDSTRTSVLSKRWRNLYEFVPDIEFRCCDLLVDCSCSSCIAPQHGSSLIVEAVDRFFRHRCDSSKIRSFSFCCFITSSHADHFQQWIRSIGKLGVEELVLNFRRSNDLYFSCSLVYEMPSLRSLKLAVCSLQPHLGNINTQLSKSLQILKLSYVSVLPGALECVLSNCLSLHTLSVDHCRFEPASKLSISGPNLQLKSLYITHCRDIESVRLCASNLMTFEFGYHFPTFIFDHVPRLQSIHLMSSNYNVLPYVIGELAQHLPQLKSLAFYTAIDSLPLRMHNRHVGINTFKNLRQLDFALDWTGNVNLLSLIPFLQSCPLLHELHLDTSYMRYTGPQVKTQAIVFHSELKKVELSGFRGTENEMEFALYMLKSAVGLELMHISRACKCYTGYGSWHYVDRSPWSFWTHRMIRRQLKGQALSKTVRLVIQYESLHEKDKWGRSDCYYDITS